VDGTTKVTQRWRKGLGAALGLREPNRSLRMTRKSRDADFRNHSCNGPQSAPKSQAICRPAHRRRAKDKVSATKCRPKT